MEEKMNNTLDAYEQSIEDSAETFIPVSAKEREEIEMIIDAENRSKNINIQLSAYDMKKVRQKSAEEGLPYQMFISSIVHKYIAGTLVDESAVLRSVHLLQRGMSNG
jgi:predicted DNA binding CopG/RHH family protein